MTQTVKSLPVMQETWFWFLCWEDSLETGMATHSSILAWRIPWTEEPGGLQSMGSQRVGHGWTTNHHLPKVVHSLTGGQTYFLSVLHLGHPPLSQTGEPTMFGKCSTETLPAVKYLGAESQWPCIGDVTHPGHLNVKWTLETCFWEAVFPTPEYNWKFVL